MDTFKKHQIASKNCGKTMEEKTIAHEAMVSLFGTLENQVSELMAE